MKKITFLLLLLVACVNVFAQDEDFFSKPDYKQIEKSIKDPTSPYSYSKLMQRYQAADSTMTLEERRHLYYGYTFNLDYKGTDNQEYNDKLAELLAKQEFTDTDYNNILTHTDVMLRDDPFSLRALEAQLFVYAQQDNVNGYIANVVKKKIVFDAIVSSGDGISQGTPIYVIRVGHEYDLLGYLGYSFGGNSKILKKKLNYLSLKNNKFGIDALYFNIEPVLKYMGKKR